MRGRTPTTDPIQITSIYSWNCVFFYTKIIYIISLGCLIQCGERSRVLFYFYLVFMGCFGMIKTFNNFFFWKKIFLINKPTFPNVLSLSLFLIECDVSNLSQILDISLYQFEVGSHAEHPTIKLKHPFVNPETETIKKKQSGFHFLNLRLLQTTSSLYFSWTRKLTKTSHVHIIQKNWWKYLECVLVLGHILSQVSQRLL